MTDSEISWTQLFKDKDIPDNLLDNLQAKVMAQIFAQPVDFEEALLVQRRRWGLVLGGSILAAGLLLLGLLWLAGMGALWQFFVPKLNLLVSMVKGMELIYQEYSWALAGATVILLMCITEIRTPSAN
ncbi:MAG: hypothetical protein ACYCV0_14785 [Desulfitobacteriaceae bacterium]